MALLLATAFILIAELDANGPRQGWGLYGYFLLQFGGWLGLWGVRERASRVFGALFILNLVFFLLLNSGLLGPQIDLIALNLVSVFFTAVAGAIALVYAIVLAVADLRGGPPRNTAGAVIGLLVIVIAAAVAFAAAGAPERPLLR